MTDASSGVIRLRWGNTNAYFLHGLLIDTDLPGTLGAFFKELKRSGLGIGDIRFVLATHYHPDHMGLIGELTALGVRLLLVDKQKDYVHFSDMIFARQKCAAFRPVREENAVVIRPEDSRAFLADIGIRGEIVPTVSHSPDGIALITDGGDCFAGDLEPPALRGGYESGSPLHRDWETIMRLRPARLWFGHLNDCILQSYGKDI